MAAGVARRRWRSLDRDRTAGAHSPPRRHSEDPCGAFGSPRSRVAASSRVPPPSPPAPPSNVSPPRTTEAADGAWAISSPAGSLRVRNEGDRGDVHSRRWRTGSTSRHRARAPCTPGRSWPDGASPARTRRSPSSRSGVTRGFVRCVRRCASAGGPGRGPGRGSRDSFVRSVAVRPNAEGGGLARRPGAPRRTRGCSPSSYQLGLGQETASILNSAASRYRRRSPPVSRPATSSTCPRRTGRTTQDRRRLRPRRRRRRLQ